MAKELKRGKIDGLVTEYLRASGIDPRMVNGYGIEGADGWGDGVLVLRIPIANLTEPTESDVKE